MKRKYLTLSRKKSFLGLVFVAPFIIGLVVIFIPSMIQAGIFSLNKITLTGSGYTLSPVKFDYFYKALFEHPTYRRDLIQSLTNMVLNSVFVIVFSFFLAGILNQNFKGRAAARALLFLPIIISSGVVVMVDAYTAMEAGNSGVIASMLNSTQLLLNLGFPPSIVEFLDSIVNQIYQIITDSGVQILVFIAALQTIPRSLYEASNIDGATNWENFWKITFPMLSPYILVNVVYTVVDSLTSYKSPVMITIMGMAQSNNRDLSYSIAMSFIFFAFEALILGVLVFMISRIVFYYD